MSPSNVFSSLFLARADYMIRDRRNIKEYFALHRLRCKPGSDNAVEAFAKSVQNYVPKIPSLFFFCKLQRRFFCFLYVLEA